MKLRIQDNTLRLRLDRVDLAAFQATGRVEATTAFGPRTVFRYALERSSEVDRLTARMDNNRIVTYIPEEMAEEWTQTDRVSLEAEQAVEEGTYLHILVEKDIGCLHTSPGTTEEKAFTHLRDKTK
ncbi:MAG TPA: hypothetical protein VFG50_16925 [Rhodothermales bacterium]|nr:hypothetical protein [Rhodothermales bacterium]